MTSYSNQKIKNVVNAIKPRINGIVALLNEGLKTHISKEDLMIAGSFLSDQLTDKKPNDIDVYFKSQGALNKFIKKFKVNIEKNTDDTASNNLNWMQPLLAPIEDRERLINKGHESKVYMANYDKTFEGLVLCVSSRAITLVGPSHKDEKQTVQLILTVADEPKALVNTFDWSITQVGFDFMDPYSLVFGDLYWQSVITRKLTYTGGKWPLASLLREAKYIARGYTIDATSQLQLALDMNRYDLMKPSVLLEQISGVDSYYLSTFMDAVEKRACNGDAPMEPAEVVKMIKDFSSKDFEGDK